MMRIMKWQSNVALILLTGVSVFTCAQSPTSDPTRAQETQSRGYWVDPSTGLMWAAKDNGRDVSWCKAIKYCRDVRLAGYSDWRLPTICELKDIYDKERESPGLAGPPKNPRKFTWHVKGNLFLTGNQWTSSQVPDDRGHPSGYAWRFDFNEGRSFDGDEISFFTNKRALCVRRAFD